MTTGIRAASDAVVRPIGADELSRWRAEQGQRVIRRGRRYWRMTRPGFWEPLHWLAPLAAQEAVMPAPGLAFRAVLRDDDAHRATGSLPVHVLDSVADYGPHLLSKDRRYRLRKAHRLVELVELTTTDLLVEQGHEVVVSTLARTGHVRLPTLETYLRELDRSRIGSQVTVLAGLADGRLAAYLGGWAIEETAYFEHLYIRTDALATQVGTALVFAFVEACRRGGSVARVVNGLETPEDRALCSYKESIGFPVRRFPSRAWLAPGLAPLIRRFRPHVFYRITGRL